MRAPTAPPPIAERFMTNEARSLQMLNKPLGDNLRREFVCVMDSLAAVEAQREGERRGNLRRVGGRSLSASGIGGG